MRRNHRPSLSGGQRQVIAIARAIYFDVKILIMDEPTAALGPSETAMVAELIRKLRAQGIGIFLVSHDMHDVFDLCDRVVVMNKGKLVGAHDIDEVHKDDILSLIIKGELPTDWRPRNLGTGSVAGREAAYCCAAKSDRTSFCPRN